MVTCVSWLETVGPGGGAIVAVCGGIYPGTSMIKRSAWLTKLKTQIFGPLLHRIFREQISQLRL